MVQRHVLYLGEINSSQTAAWRKAIEVFDVDAGRARTLSLFPEDRCEAIAGDASVVQLRLSEMQLRRPRQWGACWLSFRSAAVRVCAGVGASIVESSKVEIPDGLRLIRRPPDRPQADARGRIRLPLIQPLRGLLSFRCVEAFGKIFVLPLAGHIPSTIPVCPLALCSWNAVPVHSKP